jgi:quercetin dioxygenase-like cupin family protein
VRLKLPRGYKIAAHNHPTAEMVTIISGDFHLGMGDKLDEKKGMRLTAVMRKPPPR